ncbi:MAG TPA: tetratricopeptide repeat protein, partial [Fimbriimonadaceae bacterium]|nr:tetratricopeptide repeat protein [Fimbriimonadaceae bacterium]
DESIELSRRAVRLNPHDMNSTANLGWAYFKKNDLKTAEPYLVKSLLESDWGKRTDEDQPATWAVLGLVYERTGRKERAIETFRRALALNPREATALEGLKRLAG